tara:strand:- start:25476 stop:27020 length:1545 start_codon:yes stop_codon:yes gene_type:complete
MSSIKVNPPFDLFTDVDGKPLKNGYIYIGLDNLDAEANPAPIYWDEALTVTAAQPLRTLNGYVVNNGTVSDVHVGGNYSITVRNKNGTLVFSRLSAGSVSGLDDRYTRAFGVVENLGDPNDSATAKGSLEIFAGQHLDVVERSVGAGGGAVWIVVPVASVAPNGANIIQCTGINTLALVLRDEGIINYAAMGANPTGALGVVGCAGRITNNGEGVDNTASFVDDTQHDPINCTGIVADINTISVTHDQPTNSEVVGTCIVGPDEALAQRGIFMGGSIGTEIAIVTMAKRHQFVIDWEAGAADIANLVVDPFMDSTRYVPTDNTGGNGAYRLVAPRTLDGYRVINGRNRVSPDAYITDVSDTTFDIFPYKSVILKAKYNGTTWDVSGTISGITTALAALGFTVTNAGNIITVNHPNTLGTTSNAIVSVGTATDYYFANIFGETTTTTQVVLVDDTGSPQVPATNDSFTIQLEDVLWKYGQSIVDIGMVKLSPTLDFKDIAVNNNFWLLGNHWALK